MNDALTIRPARPADRPAMERICAHTWDWGDYIPEVWDAWLADPGGGLTVGEVDGRVIAVSKATYQPEGQVWLEGMRVDPDYRGRGIASQFLVYNLAEARRRGARVVRLGTGGNNTPVHKIMAHAGMEQVGTYVLRIAESLPDAPRPAILTANHAPAVQTFWKNSPVLAHSHGLYSFDWGWQELSAERVAQLLAAGQMAGCFAADGSLAALAPIRFDADDKVLWIGLADGQPGAVTDLATALRGHAAQVGAEKARIMLPDLAWLRDAVSAAGYSPGDWEGELWIFEIRLDQSWRLVQSQAEDGYGR
jgi:GNAT superfamily N-acetyltransferase